MKTTNSNCLTKFLVSYSFTGDHGEDEGFKHCAIFDSECEAINYLVHNKAFNSMEINELPYNVAVDNQLYAKMGVCLKYNPITKEISQFQPKYYNLNKFDKPEMLLHHFFPLYEVHCVLDVNEENKHQKTIELITQNQTQLVTSVVDVLKRTLGKLLVSQLICLVVDYDNPKIEIMLQALDNPKFEVTSLPSPSGYLALHKLYQEYQIGLENNLMTPIEYLGMYHGIKKELVN